jgi:hypothetical protein
VEPDAGVGTDRRDLEERVDGPRAHGTGGPHDHHGSEPCLAVAGQRVPERRRVHALVRVGRDPPDRVRAESCEVRALLQPGVGLGGGVDAKRPAGRGPHAFGAEVLVRGGTGCKEADHVRHVSAAHEEPLAPGGNAHELRDPSHRLALDLAGHRRETPRAHVRIHRGCDQVAEHADRCRRPADVSPEAGVSVQERMVREKAGGVGEQGAELGALVRQGGIGAEGGAERFRRFVGGDGSIRDRGQEVREQVHELVADAPERVGGNGEWRVSGVGAGAGVSGNAGSPCQAPDPGGAVPFAGAIERGPIRTCAGLPLPWMRDHGTNPDARGARAPPRAPRPSPRPQRRRKSSARPTTPIRLPAASTVQMRPSRVPSWTRAPAGGAPRPSTPNPTTAPEGFR